MRARAWQVGDLVCLMKGDEEIERREVVDRYFCWKGGGVAQKLKLCHCESAATQHEWQQRGWRLVQEGE